ncbi:MAG: hypothetical protein IH612_00425, partial [Desulfofustis sp.]|nr:hypothetical protein [Desulfofustis sp.]
MAPVRRREKIAPGAGSVLRSGIAQTRRKFRQQLLQHTFVNNGMGQAEKKVVHRAQYDNYLVEVIDRGDERFLIFAGNIVQSSMSISKPERLTLSYTRYMMAALLAGTCPEKVLIVGLGAGSLLRFINYHFPNCLIDGIDNAAD